MKVLEHGLEGKMAQCPTCGTKVQLEDVDELEERKGNFDAGLRAYLYVRCPDCDEDIRLIECYHHLVHPNGSRREMKKVNIIEDAAVAS